MRANRSHVVRQSSGRDKLTKANGARSASERTHPELQTSPCQSSRYRADLPRCVACTRKQAGDSCRFQGIRFLLRDDKGELVKISFAEDKVADGPSVDFPVKWNLPLLPEHIRRIKRTVARALLPALRTELWHIQKPEVIRRPRETEVRATCDTCMTSLFSGSYMCRRCGREACAECFSQISELTTDRSGSDLAARQSRREKQHLNPSFLLCIKRDEHQASQFSRVSRFCKDELEIVIKDMEALLAEPDVDASTMSGAPSLIFDASDAAGENSLFAGLDVSALPTMWLPPDSADPSISAGADPPTMFPAGITGNTTCEESVPFVPKTHGSQIPCHETLRFSDSELTDDVFRATWARGQPIVVTGILPKFKIEWTPEYLTSKYGSQSCFIVECQSEAIKCVTVGEFFSWFGKYEERTEFWKLKDWPPSTEFKEAFPELFKDFNSAVPVPNYVRGDGVLNVASHFPSNFVAPDLGPKMYNALASSPTTGSKGTTRLHMDMADALNIMTFASPAPDGGPGSAAWDLFRSEDSGKICEFLRQKFQGMVKHDPIHSQQFFLDETLRQQLLDEYGVKSHRIYQRPGEAVFIPAGCAHQVVNLADCVKVAVDFVSPENIDRCEKLTREFREQNQSLVWKEDVLQLQSMMWFAWLSCSRQEGSN